MQISFPGEYPELNQWKVDLYKTAPLHFFSACQILISQRQLLYPKRGAQNTPAVRFAIYITSCLHFSGLLRARRGQGMVSWGETVKHNCPLQHPGSAGISHNRKTNESLLPLSLQALPAVEMQFKVQIHQTLGCLGRPLNWSPGWNQNAPIKPQPKGLVMSGYRAGNGTQIPFSSRGSSLPSLPLLVFRKY